MQILSKYREEIPLSEAQIMAAFGEPTPERKREMAEKKETTWLMGVYVVKMNKPTDKAPYFVEVRDQAGQILYGKVWANVYNTNKANPDVSVMGAALRNETPIDLEVNWGVNQKDQSPEFTVYHAETPVGVEEVPAIPTRDVREDVRPPAPVPAAYTSPAQDDRNASIEAQVLLKVLAQAKPEAVPSDAQGLAAFFKEVKEALLA